VRDRAREDVQVRYVSDTDQRGPSGETGLRLRSAQSVAGGESILQCSLIWIPKARPSFMSLRTPHLDFQMLITGQGDWRMTA